MSVEEKKGGGGRPEAYDTETGRFVSGDRLSELSEGKYRTADNTVPELQDSSQKLREEIGSRKSTEIPDKRRKVEASDLRVTQPVFEKLLFDSFKEDGFKELYRPADPDGTLDRIGIDYLVETDPGKNGGRNLLALDLKGNTGTVGNANAYDNWKISVKLAGNDYKLEGDKFVNSYLFRKTNVSDMYCFTCIDTEGKSADTVGDASVESLNEGMISRAKAIMVTKSDLVRKINGMMAGIGDLKETVTKLKDDFMSSPDRKRTRLYRFGPVEMFAKATSDGKDREGCDIYINVDPNKLIAEESERKLFHEYVSESYKDLYERAWKGLEAKFGRKLDQERVEKVLLANTRTGNRTRRQLLEEYASLLEGNPVDKTKIMSRMGLK